MNFPTPVPSLIPTINNSPTIEDTEVPTIIPTLGPTSALSQIPTYSPSKFPTCNPSLLPTMSNTLFFGILTGQYYFTFVVGNNKSTPVLLQFTLSGGQGGSTIFASGGLGGTITSVILIPVATKNI